MILDTPIEIDGVFYDRLNLNLAMAETYDNAGVCKVSVNLRMVPARIVEGVVETRPDHVRSILLHQQPELSETVADMKVTLETYVQGVL